MYIGIGKYKHLKVTESDALALAMAECGIIRPSFTVETEQTKEFVLMFVEWFYSGDWIKED